MASFTVLSNPLLPRLTRLLFFVGLAVVLAAATAFLYFDHQRDVRSLLDHRLATLAISWQAVQVQQRYSVITYFEEYVQSPRTLALLRAAQDPEQADEARQALLKHLTPAYERLVERGVRQFHFHTPTGDSFLRFHHPERYGDNLFAVREAIRLANTERQPVFGFEVGRVVSGYRAVFPISAEDGEHLGSVELSMPFKVLMEELQDLMPDHEFQLLLEAQRQREILFDEQQALYEPWPASAAFLVEDPYSRRDDSPPPVSAPIRALIAELGQRPDLLQKMLDGDPVAFQLRVDGRHYAVLQTPVFDPGQVKVGVLVSYLDEPELGRMVQGFRIRLAGTWLTVLGLAVALYWLMRLLDDKLGERRRLSVIAETLGQGLYLTDADGKIVTVNPYALELLGYREQECLGRSAHELFHSHPDNAFESENDCAIVSAVRAGQEYRGESRFQRRDGGLLEVSVVSRPLLVDKRFAGAVTVFEDIGERKRVEHTLVESRQRLANIIWGTGVGAWEWNVRTGETRFNEHWAGMLGYRLQELQPVSIASWERRVHPDDLPAVGQALQRHFDGELEHYESEVRMRHRSGAWIWVLDRGRVISRGADGAPEWMAGTHLDITQRKQAEKQSAELLERLTKLTAELPGFVYQYQQNPDGTAAFSYASEGIDEIYGVTPEQVKTDAGPVFAVLHEEDIERVAEKIARSARDLTIWQATYRVQHPRKGLIWVEGHATPERLADGSVVWHGYIHDVSERHEAQLRLQASEANYRALVENAPVIMFRCETAAPWRMLHVSRGTERLCGHRSFRFLDGSLNWGDLICPEDREHVEKAITPAVEKRGRYSIEYRIRRADGQLRWVSEIGAVQALENAPDGVCLEGVISDISDRKKAEEEVGEARMLLEAALENSPSGIIVADAPDGRIRFANSVSMSLQITEVSEADDGMGEELAVFSKRWQVLRPDGEPLPLEYWPLTRAIEKGERVVNEEAILISGEGTKRWITMSAAPIKNEQGAIAAGIVVFSDITAQKQAQLQLERSAHFDSLTGLPNRLLLADRLEQAMLRCHRSGRKLALVFIDLDQFKPINDAHGHAVGDQALKELAKRMLDVLRAVDTVARLGGDEFVAVLSDIDGADTAQMLASRLLRALQAPMTVDGRTLQVTASIGIALYPQLRELDQVELLRQADRAMYQAKLKGKNCWHLFNEEDQAEADLPRRPSR